MKKIILFSPYCEDGNKLPTNSLDLIQFYLEDHGFKCEQYDLSGKDPEYDELSSIIGHLDSPIIGVTGYTRERFHAYRLIRRIKKECPSATIVTGGHHFGFLPTQTLEKLQEVDIVVRGEGEITFKEICEAIINGTPLNQIDGITFRGANIDQNTGKKEIVSTKDAVLENNLDRFRTWDPADYAINYHRMLGRPKMDGLSSYIQIMATRGCPTNCNFCSLSTDSVRFRSIDHVVNEIEEKIKISGIKKIAFTDSSLTINKSFVRELCDEIIARKLDIQWQCYSRVDMKRDLLEYMRKAGCIAVEVALESGSPKVLKSIGKGISLEKYVDFCKFAHELGIKVWTFLIVSSTDETYEDAMMTYDLLIKTSPHVYDFGIQVTRITPDTQLDKIARDRGVIPADFDWFDEGYRNTDEKLMKTDHYVTLPIYKEKMSVEEIQKILNKYEQLKNYEFVYSDSLWRAISGNLTPNMIKKLTPKKIYHKAKRFSIMLSNILRTKEKIRYYYNPDIDIKNIKRPEWDGVNRSFRMK